MGKGWAYAPGQDNSARLATLVETKTATLPPALGRGLIQDADDPIRHAWQSWISDLSEGKRVGNHGFIGAVPRDLTRVLEQRDALPSTAGLHVPRGIVSDQKARRHTSARNALTIEDWLALHDTIRTPQTILHDPNSDRYLLILPGDGERRTQLAIALDVSQKIDRKSRVTNVIRSAFRVRLSDIEGRIKGGKLLRLWQRPQ